MILPFDASTPQITKQIQLIMMILWKLCTGPVFIMKAYLSNDRICEHLSNIENILALLP